jgi:cation diffusion facilitator CzcD-associated flavoprotein CzcO
MAMTESAPALSADSTGTEFDVVIVGGGFAGVRALVEMDRLGLSARLLDKGMAAGGTWYWNRYPGARTDSLAWTYSFFFSRELIDEWDWQRNYPTWQDVQAFFAYVVDRFGLAARMQFQTEVISAVYDDDTNRWTISTASGDTFTCTYFINGVGHLSAPTTPDFLDVEKYQGELLFTALWPREEPDFSGKTVAIIGTGASGVQAGPKIAEHAKHLTVFQRSPNYVLPARYRMLSAEDRQEVRDNWDDIWARMQVQAWGFDMVSPGRMYDDVDDDERQRVFEENYQKGGFHFVFETFDDIVTDQRTNEAAAEFLRGKIREVADDPAIAELLSPRYPFVAKRPPIGEGYFEMFNRPNVSLIDVSSDPLVATTPRGAATAHTEYEFDVIVVATGFDISTGSLTRMNIRGAGGRSLTEDWKKNGANTFLGVGQHGYPNMFIIAGPQAPGGNQPVIVNTIVEFVGKLIGEAHARCDARVEATTEAGAQWRQLLDDVLNATVIAKAAVETRSYIVAANTEGKVQQPVFFLGGLDAYRSTLQEVADSGYKGFEITTVN